MNEKGDRYVMVELSHLFQKFIPEDGSLGGIQTHLTSPRGPPPLDWACPQQGPGQLPWGLWEGGLFMS